MTEPTCGPGRVDAHHHAWDLAVRDQPWTAGLAPLRSLPGGDTLVGVRHQVQGEPDPWWLARPEVRAGLTAVGASGLVYDLLKRRRLGPPSSVVVVSRA